MDKISVPLEIKAIGQREFSGYGSVFGNVDRGGDIVLPGAFKRTLAEKRREKQMPAMFWMHDPGRIPGKWVEMGEDDHGLAVKGVLAETPLGDEVQVLLKMEAVRGLSIGYVPRDLDYDKEGNRLIKEVDLWEVSVVSLPMNPLAQVVHAKSRLSALGEYVPTVREFERHLRDVGCSQRVAKMLIAKLFDDDRDGMPPGAQDDEAEVEETADVLAALAALDRTVQTGSERIRVSRW